jgi:hypothetical protein
MGGLVEGEARENPDFAVFIASLQIKKSLRIADEMKRRLLLSILNL